MRGLMRINYSNESTKPMFFSKLCEGFSSRMACACAILLFGLSGCALTPLEPQPAVLVTDSIFFTSALYFNEKNELIQMEDVRGINLSNRTLLPLTNPPPNPTNKPKIPCPGNGTPQSLQSKLIKFAIYYGVAKDSDGKDVRKAYKWEQIDPALTRTIKCQKSPWFQCPSPKRCITTCAGAPYNCPQYCCIY